jgi:hypothetical protein
MLLTPAHLAVVAQDTLATAQIYGYGGARVIRSAVTVRFGIDTGLEMVHPIFDTIALTPADVGRLFPITQSQDSDFTALAGVLTDGQPSQIGYRNDINGSGEFARENLFFLSLPAGGNGIDFQGFYIDDIALRLDSLTIASPGRNPNRDGLWTDFSYTATIFVNGTPVPEPTSIALFGFGAIAVGLRRWKTLATS